MQGGELILNGAGEKERAYVEKRRIDRESDCCRILNTTAPLPFDGSRDSRTSNREARPER
jgi:hypothetical protein